MSTTWEILPKAVNNRAHSLVLPHYCYYYIKRRLAKNKYITLHHLRVHYFFKVFYRYLFIHYYRLKAIIKLTSLFKFINIPLQLNEDKSIKLRSKYIGIF